MNLNFNLSLKQKALLLIAVPLFFEICFVSALFVSLKQLEQEYKREAAAKDVLICVNFVLNNIIDCAGAVGMYQVNHDEKYMGQFRQGQEDLKLHRQQLLQIANKNQRAELAVFNTVTDEVIDTFDKVNGLINTNDNLDLLRSTIRVQRLLKKVNQSGMKVVQEQATINDRQRAEQAHLRDNAEKIILAGIITSVLLAVSLALYYNQSTAARLDILLRNSHKLAMEKPLEPMLGGSDEIAKIDHAFHEMSASLQAAREKEQALTQNALDVICSLDQKGRFTDMNQAVISAWGYQKDDLLKKSIFSIISASDVASIRQSMENLALGSFALPLEIPILRRDSSIAETSWSMQWSSKEKSFFCVAHDISERKRIERLRQDVVSMVSHDLRAPLTALKVTFELFKLGALGVINDRGQQKVDRGEMQIDRMVKMINDLLDIERFEAGAFELDLSKVSMRSIVDLSIDAVHSVAERRNINIEVTGADLILRCDQDRIVRVLVNLLHNAVKFSQDGGRVVVALAQEKQCAKISVIDHGKGIAADKVALVFERFKQVEEGDVNSSGLGLAICKAIVEAHHGTIAVDSESGRGSIFWFLLPL